MATILVVDDNPVIARMLARFLEKKGHTALTACSGVEALVAAHGSPVPDLILLDLCMPEMDGMEVLRRLHEGEEGAASAGSDPRPEGSEKTPDQQVSKTAEPVTPVPQVIFFSAVDDPAVIAEAMHNGAKDYWVKTSFKFDDLPKAISKCLSDRS